MNLGGEFIIIFFGDGVHLAGNRPFNMPLDMVFLHIIKQLLFFVRGPASYNDTSCSSI